MRSSLLVGLALVLCAVILVLPQASGMSIEGQRALASAALVLTLWITRALPAPVSVAILVVTLLAVGAVPTYPAAVSGFASPVVLFFLCAYLIAFAVVTSGLAQRFSFQLLRVARRGMRHLFAHQLLLFCTGAYIVPSAITRSTIMIPVYEQVLRELGHQPGSSFGRAVMLPHAMLNASASSALLTGGMAPITAAALMGGVSWLDWFVFMAVPQYLLIVCAGIAIFLWARLPASLHVTQSPSPPLPPWSAAEVKVLIVLASLSMVWVLDFWHGLHPAFPAMAATMFLLLPRLGVVEWHDLRGRLSWSQVILFGGALTLAKTLVESGAAAWLAARLFDLPYVAGLGRWQMVILIILVSSVVHVVVPSIPGALAVLIPVLTPFAGRVNLHPLVVGFIVTMAVDALKFYPLQSVIGLMVYERGYVRAKDFFQTGVVILLLLMVLTLGLYLHYWDLVLGWIGSQ